MLKKEDKKTGRTFWDFIHEHLIVSVIVAMSLIIMIGIVVVVYNIPVKIGNLEIGRKTAIVHDTIIKTRVDTHYIKSKVNEQITLSSIKAQPKVLIKHDTVVILKGSSNVNSGTNNGIIGNNNDVKVNVNEIQRKLNAQTKQQLINLIKQEFERAKKEMKSCIQVSSSAGNSEAYNLAEEIVQFLKQQQFNVNSSIGQFQQSPPIKGVIVGYKKIHMEGREDCLGVEVGFK